MNTRNQVKRTLSAPTSIQYVRDLLGSEEIPHRSELAARVCERFGFQDARGQAQRGGCLKALRELEAAGHFALPAARTNPGRRCPWRLWVKGRDSRQPFLARDAAIPGDAASVAGSAGAPFHLSRHLFMWAGSLFRSPVAATQSHSDGVVDFRFRWIPAASLHFGPDRRSRLDQVQLLQHQEETFRG